MCEQGGGPGRSFPIHSSPVLNKSYGFCGSKAQWNNDNNMKKKKKKKCIIIVNCILMKYVIYITAKSTPYSKLRDKAKLKNNIYI